LKIIGAEGSSSFIASAVAIKIGMQRIIKISESRISNILFQTLPQFSSEVFFISITGIEFMSVSVVLEDVISK
jgi:hypothetical protein